MCATCGYLRHHISLQSVLGTCDQVAELSSLHVGTYTVDIYIKAREIPPILIANLEDG